MFRCPTCGKDWSQIANLKRHHAVKHKKPLKLREHWPGAKPKKKRVEVGPLSAAAAKRFGIEYKQAGSGKGKKLTPEELKSEVMLVAKKSSEATASAIQQKLSQIRAVGDLQRYAHIIAGLAELIVKRRWHQRQMDEIDKRLSEIVGVTRRPLE